MENSKEGQDLQEYYNSQKYWILVNRAESSFGLGDFAAYHQAIEESKLVPHHPWQEESFTEQIGKLEAEMKKIGHLLEPKWKMPEPTLD